MTTSHDNGAPGGLANNREQIEPSRVVETEEMFPVVGIGASAGGLEAFTRPGLSADGRHRDGVRGRPPSRPGPPERAVRDPGALDVDARDRDRRRTSHRPQHDLCPPPGAGHDYRGLERSATVSATG